MASSKMFMIIIVIVAAALVPAILATDYVIGDENGWKLNFDYQAWAQGKEFKVGDRIIFKYPKEKHNVLKVDATGFQQCETPAGTQALNTGEDVITLVSPGKKWYICGVSNHCEMGKMKLSITVQPLLQSSVMSPAPSPSPLPAKISPTSAATPIGSSSVGYTTVLMMVSIFLILGIIIV